MPECSRYHIREILENVNFSNGDSFEVPTNILINLIHDYTVLEHLLDERNNENDIYKSQIKEYQTPFIYPHDGTWYSESKTNSAPWENGKPSI